MYTNYIHGGASFSQMFSGPSTTQTNTTERQNENTIQTEPHTNNTIHHPVPSSTEGFSTLLAEFQNKMLGLVKETLKIMQDRKDEQSVKIEMLLEVAGLDTRVP